MVSNWIQRETAHPTFSAAFTTQTPSAQTPSTETPSTQTLTTEALAEEVIIKAY